MSNLKPFLQSIAKEFGVLKKWTDRVEEEEFEDEIKKLIVPHIRKMINNNMQELLNLLYQADVSEEKIKEGLMSYSKKDSAELITDFYIDRMKARWKTRQEYGNGNSEWDWNI
jgi:ATP-dependent Zn protease